MLRGNGTTKKEKDNKEISPRGSESKWLQGTVLPGFLPVCNKDLLSSNIFFISSCAFYCQVLKVHFSASLFKAAEGFFSSQNSSGLCFCPIPKSLPYFLGVCCGNTPLPGIRISCKYYQLYVLKGPKSYYLNHLNVCIWVWSLLGHNSSPSVDLWN